MKRKRLLVLLLVPVLALLLFTGTVNSTSTLSVYFFDVGQADATLLVSDEAIILIDAILDSGDGYHEPRAGEVFE